jgi:hypothetical protein
MKIPFDLERFKAGDIALTRDGREAKFLYYDESIKEKDFRLGAVANGQVLLLHASGWGEAPEKEFKTRHDLVAMKPKAHKHQALMDSYQEGQAWQWDDGDGSGWRNRLHKGLWEEPSWDERLEYRLHPHNDLIQAFNLGAEIEYLESTDKWGKAARPSWREDLEYRIKPKTKMLYQWAYKTKSMVWVLHPKLMDEEHAAEVFHACEYKKTAVCIEVKQ